MNKEKIEIPRTTLDFYTYEKEGITYYEFDATECSPPEPMVNAVVALNNLKDDKQRLIGTFFHIPTPLFERIKDKYSFEIEELQSGDFRIEFKIAK